jgi:hypothetical protein
MKRTILLIAAFMALFATSCKTHKYGCGLSHIETHPYKSNGCVGLDSFLVIQSKNSVEYKLINYRPDYRLCRGYGKVEILDTIIKPHQLLIRMGGALMKDDSVVTPVKFIIIYDGKFYKTLLPYANTGKDVYFEGYMLFPNRYYGDDIQVATNTWIDHIDSKSSNYNNVIFANYKK